MRNEDKFKLDMMEGARHRFVLTNPDLLELLKPVKGKGGVNTMLRFLQDHLIDPMGDHPSTLITDGMLERVPDYSHFGNMNGGYQGRVPIDSCRRAGLVPPDGGSLFS